MAKIDTSKIAGYETMSAEEKISALEAYETDDSEIERYKNAASRANSEAAAYKKQLNEQKANGQTNESRIVELEGQLSEMKKQNRIASLTAKYISLGYDNNLAAETAEAYVNGNDDVVFANAAKANEAKTQKMREDFMNSTPRPAAGSPAKTYTLEEFRKLSPEERLTYSNEHPEEYKKIYGGT